MRARSAIAVLLLAAAGLSLAATSATAAPAPAWSLSAASLPDNLPPGESVYFTVAATDVGSAPTDSSPAVLEVSLSPSLLAKGVYAASSNDMKSPTNPTCSFEAHSFRCESTASIRSGYRLGFFFEVEAPPGTTAQLTESQVQITGAGAGAATATISAPISAQAVPFGITFPLRAPLYTEDGAPATLAGSHPYQQDIEFGFPVRRGFIESGAAILAPSGAPHEIRNELPRGLIVDPAASPLLCTEAELTTHTCPDRSQVGLIEVTTVAGNGQALLGLDNLYNMVPPPGRPAELGFDALGAGILAHILGGLRSDSDFGLEAISPDLPAIGSNPFFRIHAWLWGDPSAAAHNGIRGACKANERFDVPTTCPVPEGPTALLTTPVDCSSIPLRTEVLADSWEQPGLFQRSTYDNADLEGNPVTLSGCNELAYEPTIEANPTTVLTDSPTGLEFDLTQPQDFDKEDTATAELKDARVTLPEGMVANPSQADGLDSCTEEEIGYLGEGHYSKQPQSCPDASKLGTMEVSSPLLAEVEEGGTKIAHDPETGEPIPRPLKGSVYLAKPFKNQFGSLLAIYLAVEDEQSGIVAKLAGKVEPDPHTGQLTTVFTENPELPLSDIHLSLFKGPRASLITPISCGSHTTTSDLTPWSTPEGKDAHPESSFQTTASPNGGSCPSSEAAAQNHPSFQAGTLAPQAGAFSPFVLKLSREDGTQRIAGIDTLLPPGLSGKLAGIGQCSEAQIAQARAREKPSLGIEEKEHPSCPSSSEVGSVDVSAGAGPTPFHTSGHAYLAGPYKGAPLSLAVIVPAVAGPFDLGAVVTRVALHVEPETAQIHAVSDPFPQILDGLPLDLRSVSLTMGRPDFTLNPTSCDPMQITGSATSALGASAALSNPFQVGGCSSLPFKPKLSLKLKGGTRRTSHPKLIATLKAKPGEANIAKAQVKLPPSAFLDQAHIRTVCTRVQFAANACPQGSIYGKAEATTPLLAYPLSGDVYLRSSTHKLPDLVVALKGPDYQPIEIDLDGKTDSVRGALRNTFEAVPDAPVSTFRLELFGGKRGLVVNSRNLCAHRYKAEVNLTGQSGKVYDTTPVVGTGCKKAKRHGRHHH